MEETVKKLVEKELAYLQDNQYRYKLDNKDNRHDKIIQEHQDKINKLKSLISNPYA